MGGGEWEHAELKWKESGSGRKKRRKDRLRGKREKIKIKMREWGGEQQYSMLRERKIESWQMKRREQVGGSKWGFQNEDVTLQDKTRLSLRLSLGKEKCIFHK